MRFAAALLVALLLPSPAGAAPKVALIMDDLGYSLEQGRRALGLPSITAAVIPGAPHARLLARRAAEQDREVIIHLPMTAGAGRELLDPGGVHDDMAPEEIGRTVREAFKKIPQASGLNNHMGSRFTANTEAMHWVMHELAGHQAFFVDSLTTPDSVGTKMARRHGLATARRDVFLDNRREALDINDQFNKLIRIARQQGQAIGIAHPYPETLDYLEQALPLMKDAGVELVPVSRLLDESAPEERVLVLE